MLGGVIAKDSLAAVANDKKFGRWSRLRAQRSVRSDARSFGLLHRVSAGAVQQALEKLLVLRRYSIPLVALLDAR